jgi:hypothetical protein
MKRRSLGEVRGALAIALPGAVGALVVVRTLTAYWGHDWLASLIVCAIGTALGLGLLELFARLGRATRLERELRALPKSPSESTLETASPLLSSLLRARLEHAPLPNLSEGSAPFLTGLLVMLGLLGTLLGLFQTVRGAGHALTSSTDIDALRHSLSAPIDGLTRSFGCSAAGISASAMLGLAIALVRRREVDVMRAFFAYASGPLRALSPQRRQLQALEQLAEQGSALPGAASAIETVAVTLGELSGQLNALQQTAHKAQQRAFSDLLASVRGEFSKAAGELGEALHGRVSPLLEQMATRSGEALVAQAGALADVARDLTRELERDATTRREQAAEAMQALRARFDEAERVRAATHTQELETVLDLASRTVADAERRERALADRWQELVTRFDAQVEASHSSESARLQSIAELASAGREADADRLQQLERLSRQVGGELERLSGALSTQLEQRLASERSQEERAERASVQLAARAEGASVQLAERAERVLGQLSERAEHVFVQLSERAERVSGQLSERAEHAFAQLSASASAIEQGGARQAGSLVESAALLDACIARQSSALEGLIARVGALLPELADAAQSGAASTLARLREHAEAQAARFAELEAALSRGREQHALGLAEQLESHATELEQRLSKTSAAVQEAAVIWQTSSAEMQAVAELFANSVERQREASDAWLESLGEIEGAVERAGRHAASDALAEQLASTQEVFARQLQFQRELFDQLRALRAVQSRVANGEQDVSV